MKDHFDDSLPTLAVFLALLLSVVIIIAGAQGVRGTDQYNYLEDTETILAKEAPVTNLLFPARLIREGDTPTPAWFHHNGPPITVAAWLGQWTGAYRGWILMNLLAHLTVAACLFALARKVANQRIALWTVSVYLLSPNAIWLGINVLQEMFFAGLLALVLTGFVFRSQPVVLLLGTFALWAGVLCHPIFQAAAMVLTLYVAIEAIMARRYLRCLAALMSLGVVVFLVSQAGLWFPSSFQPDLVAIITSSIPGESNMFWHYSLEQRTISAQLLLDKFVASARRHFLSPSNAPFYVYTNLAVVCLVYLALRHLRSAWKVLLPVSLFLGLYAGMIVLQQNQPRYQQIVVAASFLVIALAWARSGWRIPDYVLSILLAGNLALAGFLSVTAADDASQERASLDAFRGQLEAAGIGEDARVAAFDLSPHSPLAVTIKPRLLLSIRTDMMEPDNIARALELFQPTHVIGRAATAPVQLDSMIGSDATELAVIDKSFFGDLRLIKINDR